MVALLLFAGYKFSRTSERSAWKVLNASTGELIVKVTANGSVTPKNKVVVNTPIAGRVDRVVVEEGAKVRKGQQLALLSSSDRVALMDSLHQGVPAEERARLQEMYRPTPILAPATGTVVLRNVNQGQSVTQENTLFEISDVLIVISKVDETDIAKVFVGQTVEVGIDAYGGERFSGVVERIGQQSTVTNNVTTYDVFITASANFPDKIKSGMSASVDYLIAKKENALLLPSWLSEGRKNTSVKLQLVGPGGEHIEREVTLGESNGESVEVLAGLTAADQVLYKPLSYENDSKSLPFSVGAKKK